MPLPHCDAAEHDPPTICLHVPDWQSPVVHCVFAEHDAPTGARLAVHTPDWHVAPLLQSVEPEHVPPSACLHMPDSHTPLPHCDPAEQEPLSGTLHRPA